MNPTKSAQVTHSADVPRKVLCQHYSHCLDLTILRGWPGFSCEQCERYDLEPERDAEHWKEQAGRCRLLLARLFAPQPKYRRTRAIDPDRNRGEFRKAGRPSRHQRIDRSLEGVSEGGTIRLPEAFLAHLMLLWENRTHE